MEEERVDSSSKDKNERFDEYEAKEQPMEIALPNNTETDMIMGTRAAPGKGWETIVLQDVSAAQLPPAEESVIKQPATFMDDLMDVEDS